MNRRHTVTIGRRLAPWIVPVTLILSWHLLSRYGVIPTKILPSPGGVLEAAAKLIRTHELEKHVAISARRAFLGLLIGGGIGFTLGLLNGLLPFAEVMLDSSVQMFRTIPSLALIPLVILWFGIGEEAKICLISISVFFPLYINTFHGIRTVDAGLKEMGRVYGLKGWSLFRQVILPGALPSILIGLRYALGAVWLTLIAAEALAAESGIGYMTTTAREFMQTDIVVVGVLLYALLGKLADVVTRLLERSLLQWDPVYRKS